MVRPFLNLKLRHGFAVELDSKENNCPIGELMIQVNIFQAPKGVEEIGRGLNVCSDPQIAGGAIVNRRQENAPAFAFGGELSLQSKM